MSLLKVLLISWSVGASLSFINDIGIEYSYLCLIMSVSYIISALFCFYYFTKELELKNNTNAYIIASICFCMVISAWFNYLFINVDLYYLLMDARRGDGLSWKNIYKTVELVALLIAGRNGIINLIGWLVCRRSRFNVIIANNSTYNTGR